MVNIRIATKDDIEYLMDMVCQKSTCIQMNL